MTPSAGGFETVFQIVSVVGAVVTVGGGLLAWVRLRPEMEKLRADARKAMVDTVVSEDAAEDAHWQAIIKAQTEAIVAPLREEVHQLRGEVRVLREEVETHRARYWRAVTYIRVLLAWSRYPSSTDVPPPPPELAVDI